MCNDSVVFVLSVCHAVFSPIQDCINGLTFSFQKEFPFDDKEEPASLRRGLDAKCLAALPKGKSFSKWSASTGHNSWEHLLEDAH